MTLIIIISAAWFLIVVGVLALGAAASRGDRDLHSDYLRMRKEREKL